MSREFESFLDESLPAIRRTVNLRSKNLMLESNLLESILPSVSVADFRMASMRYNTGNRMIASTLAYDSDIPMDRPEGVSSSYRQIQQIKHGLGTEMNSIDIMDLEEIQNRMSSQGSSSDILNVYRDGLMPRIEWLTDAIALKVKVMGWQAVTTGAYNHVDSRNGVTTTVSYGANPLQFIAYNPVLDWALPATPGLRILMDDIEAAKTRARGRYPNRIVMHSRELKSLLQQDDTKAFLLAAQGSAMDPSLFSRYMARREQVEAFLSAQFGTMTIVVFDETYEDYVGQSWVNGKRVGGTLTELPFLPKGAYILTWGESDVNTTGPDFDSAEIPSATLFGTPGAIVFGPHPDNGFRQGVYTNTEVVSRDPYRVKMTASAVAVPFIDQPELLFSRVAGNPV